MSTDSLDKTAAGEPRIDFRTSPESYHHWKLSIDGRVARLALDVDENATLFPGYELKLNSYDLGVDIELYDAVQRLRFEHPEVGTVVVTSDKPRVFCAGANIRMLSQSTHAHKVNFCKFTNETRNGIEDATDNSGLRFVAAVNGACAGLGMSIALLCDLRFCADSAKFVTSFSQRGLVAEHGQSWILPRVIGPSRALDLLWSSRRVLADEALQIGLVDRVYGADEVLSRAIEYVQQLADSAAPVSLQVMKRQIYRHMNMSLGDAMAESTQLMDESLLRDDFKEGVASFMEKRAPAFSKIKTD